MQSFERLEVWQQTRQLVNKIYMLTRDFPHEERHGLTNQIRRSVISISSNIAEGAGRFSAKDQKHFYNMAFGSIYEVLSQLILANDLGFINDEMLLDCRSKIKTISVQLSNLRAYADQRSKTQ